MLGYFRRGGGPATISSVDADLALAVSAAVQVVLTAALVLVTAWYARLTRRISEKAAESAAAAEDSASAAKQSVTIASRPFLRVVYGKAPLKPPPAHVNLRLDNIGNGPAIYVSISVVDFTNGDSEKVGSIDVEHIASGERSPRDLQRYHEIPLDRRLASDAWGIRVDHCDVFGNTLCVTWRKDDQRSRLEAGQCWDGD